jgi:glutamine amidotransferase
MNIAIIKYNAGNVQSVLYALGRLNLQAEVTDDPEKLRAADKVIFPGVGEASTAMTYLRARKLDELISGLIQPVLGICLGMQLLCAHSEENDTNCIGIFEERVRRFKPADQSLKVPQIGWNSITDLQSVLFRDISEGAYVYSVHSYYVSKGEHTIATSEYGTPYSAAIHKNNFYGVQFHPEKSAAAGLQVLKNFLLS